MMVNSQTIQDVIQSWVVKTNGSDSPELMKLIDEITVMGNTMVILSNALKYASSRMMKNDAIGAIALQTYIDQLKGVKL